MSSELLFEIGTEEIPAGYIVPALEHLKQNMTSKLRELNISCQDIKGVATPRRFTLCVEQLADCQPDRIEESVGPPKTAAFDQNGQPTKAAVGFAKSKGVDLAEVQTVKTAKGEYLMVSQEIKGRKTEEILSVLLPELIAEIPFPKSMRWGSGKFTFARPIQWILAVFNKELVPFSIKGVPPAGLTSRGHRFMAPDSFAALEYSDYIEQLRDRHVIADIQERKEAVVSEINKAAKIAGGVILPDESLVDMVANLVEEPHAICGAFDSKFLTLPKEVLITSMREHQKYFAIIDEDGSVMPNFVAVNNTDVVDPVLGAEGHQRVLRARLEDAMFFFDDDKSKKLEDFAGSLEGIVFQTKLGTMQEKTARMIQLTGWLAEGLAPELLAPAKRAAFLAKADLLSAMVTEFPSLQGVMGRDYALRDGEDAAVALGVQEHYMPVRAGSALPSGKVGALVSIADRIDIIAGCFGIGQVPSGTVDPFGLRRLALGLIHIVADQKFSFSLGDLCLKAFQLFGDKMSEDETIAIQNMMNFIKGRYVNDQIGRGVSAETVEAVTSIRFDDLVDLTLRVKALQVVQTQSSFPLLAGSFKRVMNIIKDHRDATVDETFFQEEAEKELFAAYSNVKKAAEPLIAAREYEEAMQVILQMKEPVDRFFDDVMVMAEDERLKNNRLALLYSIAVLFLQIGDFSKMHTAA